MKTGNRTTSREPSAKTLRERRTTKIMIEMYCRHHHDGYDRHAKGEDSLCPACRELTAYVDARIDRCPMGENKTTCKDCPIHCYSAEKRERIRQVMRYAGPRLTFTHPLLTYHHLKDGRAGKQAADALRGEACSSNGNE